MTLFLSATESANSLFFPLDVYGRACAIVSVLMGVKERTRTRLLDNKKEGLNAIPRPRHFSHRKGEGHWNRGLAFFVTIIIIIIIINITFLLHFSCFLFFSSSGDNTCRGFEHIS